MQSLLDDPNQDVNRDGDPDLRLDRIFGCAEERFDAQMLFDSFEEEFDLPAAAIELGDGEGWQGEVVGENDQGIGGLRVLEANAAQRGLAGREGAEPVVSVQDRRWRDAFQSAGRPSSRCGHVGKEPRVGARRTTTRERAI